VLSRWREAGYPDPEQWPETRDSPWLRPSYLANHSSWPDLEKLPDSPFILQDEKHCGISDGEGEPFGSQNLKVNFAARIWRRINRRLGISIATCPRTKPKASQEQNQTQSG
jgi:hypothetical protein